MKTLSRCRNNIEADNVVLIDVDTYNFDNVIVLDIPESHTKKQGGSSDKNRPLRTYIYIDDDESPCNHHADAQLGNERNFENVASSSRRYSSESASPVKLSKGKRTYSGRGFNARLDSDSSDEDGPDCEFIEDFSGKFKEQWEKASMKRKAAVHNDHASSSRSYRDVHSVFGVNKSKQKHAQGSKVNGKKNVESSSCDAQDVGVDKDDLPFGETRTTSSEEENEKNDLKHAANTREKESFKRKDAVHNHHTCSSKSYGDVHGVFQVNQSKQKHAQGFKVNETRHQKKVESSNHDARDIDTDNDDLPFDEIPSSSEKNDFENVTATCEKVSLKTKASVCNDHTGSSWPFGDDHSEFGVNRSKQKHPQGSNINDHNSHEKDVGSFNFDARDVDGRTDDSPLGETPFTNDEDENEKNDLENAATTDDDVPVDNSIIGQREKLKETDEYKQALEQELLARQEALQIQAEEARQLRRLQKRKNAECLRLLDMERRQKQRVEEIREIQKKDEENMNLKEQYRAEVIQELKRLEVYCHDMASLLHGLGIRVGNGPVPLPHEVRAAYKRALLSFHPDRASGSDMRQQVEAEEKFKLISRMKEKFAL
ncbi:hypothetical protein QVD17_18496 [Tagetes erecta]|uniref:J domain-containing protein n=1 Tax=Tagetes erecta TaxID=13708 RepID=A0AAD8KHV3_TARER|nr:hypothetical protein QVD17_18496 [Tagetes erecta]